MEESLITQLLPLSKLSGRIKPHDIEREADWGEYGGSIRYAEALPEHMRDTFLKLYDSLLLLSACNAEKCFAEGFKLGLLIGTEAGRAAGAYGA